MPYLVVDKNHQEMIFKNRPQRVHISSLSPDDCSVITSYWTDASESIHGVPIIGTGIELPTGTILRLLGKTLTWEDAPALLTTQAFWKS